MFCPVCGSEYRDGFTRCNDCEVDLVEQAPSAPEPDAALVRVYEAGNAALIPLIESLFDGAGIEFMMKSETIQDLYGWGRFGSNLNFLGSPVQFFVREEDADEARALIETLPEPADEPADS